MTFLKSQGARTIFLMGWVSSWFEKLTLIQNNVEVDAHFLRHIERLAITAPHVLADIGFERDDLASFSTQTVWRKGRFRITLTQGAPTVVVNVE
jgi:hypothetical protein